MSHLYATRTPQSSARRMHIHGPLHPLETALSIKRIGLIPALKIANIIAWSVIVAMSAIYAASDAPASKQNATPIEARSGGKVSL